MWSPVLAKANALRDTKTGDHKGRPYGAVVVAGLVGAGLVPARASPTTASVRQRGRPQGSPLRGPFVREDAGHGFLVLNEDLGEGQLGAGSGEVFGGVGDVEVVVAFQVVG